VMPYHRELKRMQNPVGLRIGKHFLSRYMPVSILDRGERKRAEEGLARMAALTVRLLRAGVRVAAGTDAPNPSLVPGLSLHAELGELQDQGLAPVEALRTATSDAAALLQREDLGVLRPGSAADLLCLDGDPSADVRELSTLT